MKIINAIHAQGIGGVDQVFRNYTEILAETGHEVALLMSNNGNDKYEYFGVKIFKLKNLSQISDFFNLLKIVISFKPDLIICHSNRLMKWMKFLRFFNKIGLVKVKSIAVNHGITFKKSLHCDFIISINQQISDLVVSAGFASNKSFILPNVIKVDQSYNEKTFKKPPVIAIYGRLEPRKGFDILIKACEILSQKNHDFRLKIGGFEVQSAIQGSYGWNTIKALAKAHNIFDNCEFFGVAKDKKSFFENVDIFCVPSREEPFGLVILESFLYSTLVISSDSDGGKLLIKDGENGLLFANENYEDLSQKIILAFEDSSLRNRLTRKAFLKLEKEFSFEILGQEMSKILQEVTKKC
jgi:glycosyltransferase involved in cell wall biosynthesis